MHTRLLFCTILSLSTAHLLTSAAEPPRLDPNVAKAPVAPRKPKIVGLHGDKIDDPYFWLREKENPELLAHLKAENAYTAAVLAPFQAFEDALYKEMLGRIKQADVSAPYLQRGYWLYQRTEEGKQYPIYCRKEGESRDAGRDRAERERPRRADKNSCRCSRSIQRRQQAARLLHRHHRAPRLRFSPQESGHRRGSKNADREGGRSRLGGGQQDDLLHHAERGKTNDRLWRFTLGDAKPTPLYEEKDELFNLGVGRSRDGAVVFLGIESSRTTEFRFVAADKPTAEWQLLAPRRDEIKYYPEHRGDQFYIRTNDGAKEFRVVTAPVGSPGVEHWKEFIPSAPGVTLQDFEPFANRAVVVERSEGLVRVRVTDYELKDAKLIDLPEPAYLAGAEFNPEFATGVFRFRYESPVTPPSIFCLRHEHR